MLSLSFETLTIGSQHCFKERAVTSFQGLPRVAGEMMFAPLRIRALAIECFLYKVEPGGAAKVTLT
jgi:hypothetical protein